MLGSGDWITVITRATGTFREEMVLSDGKTIAPTGQAFEVDFGTTARWEGDLLIEEFVMQNFLMLGSTIAEIGKFGSSAGSGEVGFVDTRDIGAVAAEIAASPAAHVGKTHMLTGPELLSYANVATVLSDVLGRPVAFSERTTEQDTQEMVSAGLPEPVAAMNARAVSMIAEGDAAWLSEDVQAILGQSPRTFAQFATDHAATFSVGR